MSLIVPAMPVGPSACVNAATAKEAAFRIDYPLSAARNTRVIALDEGAAEVVRLAADYAWEQARFFLTAAEGDELIALDGQRSRLVDEIAESNIVVMISTDGSNPQAAATIGAACRERGIMTAGLVVTPGQITTDALLALRPYARILLVPAEPDDLIEILRATRA
jgi:hypothetical protein